ncbi:MAG TPA: NarK/NasA family nitrate transporter [Actinocrinis sp.]|jgi:NNP family nitrate/nitrite transporter-like MFS transporter
MAGTVQHSAQPGTSGPGASGAPEVAGAERTPAAAYVNLVVATVGFALTFWSWNLIAPLASTFQGRLGFSSFQLSALTAVPVIIGSLGRIPVGALTDRFGARLMFPLFSALSIIPTLLLIPAKGSYWALVLVGFILGIGGTTFAIGIPHVNAWFPASRRGFATGVFGMGMGGTALSSFFTPRIFKHGEDLPFWIVSIALAAFCVLALLTLRNPPNRQVPSQPLARRLASAGRLSVTWELAALYAVGFGGIVAFGVYLPTFLHNSYGLDSTDAGTRAAGFSLVTVVLRAVGGTISDHIHPAKVTAAALGVVGLFAVVEAFDPLLAPIGTIAFLVMAAGLGTASGSVFALVARVAPAAEVGSVTGIVGAIGGLGGFVPPLVMGAIYTAKHTYSIGLMLLSDLAFAAALYSITRMRERGRAAGA